MRRAIVAIAVTIGAAPALTVAQSADTWRHWQFSMPIVTPAPSEARLVSVVVPAAVAANARADWADLRIVDASDKEQPYVLRDGARERTREWRPVRLLDPGFVAGEYTQAVLDAGEQPAVHNRLRLDVSTGGDFQTWMEIAVSADARTWQVVRDRAPVYDLSRAGFGDKREASYPDSVSRYVRVRLLDRDTRFQLDGAAVAEEIPARVEFLPADLVFSQVSPASPGAKPGAWISQGPADGIALAEIRVETTQPQFTRPVAVESSDDGAKWRAVAWGEVSRVNVRGEARETLAVPIWASPARHWRVSIHDGNDQPLTNVTIRAFVRPRRVVFREAPGGAYRLLFGHSRAEAPRYDLARLTDAAALDAATPASLGAAVTNLNYADPAPWTERHPVVLWGAAILAVLVLGAVAVRALQGVRS